MSTPPSTAAVPSAPHSAPTSWRAVILWLVFVAVLGTGVVLAARLGPGVPRLIEESVQ